MLPIVLVMLLLGLLIFLSSARRRPVHLHLVLTHEILFRPRSRISGPIPPRRLGGRAGFGELNQQRSTI